MYGIIDRRRAAATTIWPNFQPANDCNRAPNEQPFTNVNQPQTLVDNGHRSGKYLDNGPGIQSRFIIRGFHL